MQVKCGENARVGDNVAVYFGLLRKEGGEGRGEREGVGGAAEGSRSIPFFPVISPLFVALVSFVYLLDNH